MEHPASLEFTSKVEKAPGIGGWCFVRLSLETLQALRTVAGKNGNVPIIASLGKTTWPTTTMSMGGQQWFFALSAMVRKAEEVKEGDTVTVRISVDFERLKKS